MSTGKGVSPGQGQAETPVLLQVDTSRGWGCRAVGIQTRRRRKELFPARVCQDQAAAELLAGLPTAGTLQPCPAPALPARGTGSCRTQAEPPGAAQAVLGEKLLLSRPVLCRRYTTTGNQPRPAPSARCWDGTQQCCPAVPLGSVAPWQIMELFPPPRGTATACHPHSPDRMETCQSQSPACRTGQGCVPGGRGSMAGWGPRAGSLGWVHRVPWLFVVPSILP